MGDDAGVPGQSVSEQLAAGQDFYSKVGEGPDAPPPGLYTFQLVSVEFKFKKDGGELLIMWTHVVMKGEHKGEQMNDFSKPKSPKRYPIQLMRQRINRLGWAAPDDLRELEEIIPQIDTAGPIYTGLVTHSGNFANVEVKDLIEQYGARSGQRAAPDEPDGEQPATPEVTSDATPVQTTLEADNPVTFTIEGKEYSGVVKSVDASGIAVKVEGETDTFVFDDPNDLTLVEPATESPADGGDAPTEPAVDAPPVANDPPSDELIAFAIGLGYDDLEGTTQKLLVEALKENHTFKAEELTEGERLLLVRNNIPVKPKPAKPTKPRKPAKPKKPSKPSKPKKPTKPAKRK